MRGRWIDTALLLLLLFTAAGAWRNLVGPDVFAAMAPASPSSLMTLPSATTVPRADYQGALLRNPFSADGALGVRRTVPSEEEPSAADISLEDLRLLGTTLLSGGRSSAAIGGLSATPQTVRIGQMVGSWKVDSIGRGTVRLKRGAVTHDLMLNRHP